MKPVEKLSALSKQISSVATSRNGFENSIGLVVQDVLINQMGPGFESWSQSHKDF